MSHSSHIKAETILKVYKIYANLKLISAFFAFTNLIFESFTIFTNFYKKDINDLDSLPPGSTSTVVVSLKKQWRLCP